MPASFPSRRQYAEYAPDRFPIAGRLHSKRTGRGKILKAGLSEPTSGGKKQTESVTAKASKFQADFYGEQAPDCALFNQAVRGDPGYPGQHDSTRIKVLLSPTSPHFGHFNLAAGFIFSYISLPQRPQRMWSSWATSSVGISSRRHSGHCNEGMMLPPFGNCQGNRSG